MTREDVGGKSAKRRRTLVENTEGRITPCCYLASPRNCLEPGRKKKRGLPQGEDRLEEGNSGSISPGPTILHFKKEFPRMKDARMEGVN